MDSRECVECVKKELTIKALRKSLDELEREIREETRSAYAEGQWNERERHEQKGFW